MDFLASGPHFATDVTSRWNARMGRGCIFQNCCLLSPLHCFNQIVNTIDVAALRRITPRCNARRSVASIRPGDSGRPTMSTRLALAGADEMPKDLGR